MYRPSTVPLHSGQRLESMLHWAWVLCSWSVLCPFTYIASVLTDWLISLVVVFSCLWALCEKSLNTFRILQGADHRSILRSLYEPYYHSLPWLFLTWFTIFKHSSITVHGPLHPHTYIHGFWLLRDGVRRTQDTMRVLWLYLLARIDSGSRYIRTDWLRYLLLLTTEILIWNYIPDHLRHDCRRRDVEDKVR